MTSRAIVLRWERYTSYEKARQDDYARSKGVYLMADNKGLPLYIGMTCGKWGFADRYNATGFLDACMYGSGNLIFFAKLEDKLLCKEVEAQLLWQEKPRFNKRKMQKPQRSIDIKHEGKVPKFKYHDCFRILE
jgi:hypothetical protein